MDQQPTALDPYGRDIPGECARLRAAGDVVAVTLPGGIPAYAITRHDHLHDLMLDDRVSKDPRRHWALWDQALTRPAWRWVLGWIGPQNMLNTYGRDHTRLRKPLQTTFTARRIEALRPPVSAIIERLLAPLTVLPAGATADLRAVLAYPLPMEVISQLFGVPADRRPQLAGLVTRIMDTTATDEQAAETVAMIDTVVSALIDHKRKLPGDDLTSALIAVLETDDGRLTPDELRDTILLTYGAGFETTVHLIANAAHLLLTHRGVLRRLLAGEISWERVLAEVLRLRPSIASLPLRYAVEAMTLSGVTIPAGAAILTTIAAANRDPERYGPDTDEFNPERPRDPRSHLAFGVGVHHCLGRALALMEAEMALRALFQHFPGIRLAHDPEPGHVPSFIANGPATLHATLSAPPIPANITGKVLTFGGQDHPAMKELRDYVLYAYDGGRTEGDSVRTIALNTRRSNGSTYKILAEAGVPLRSRGGTMRSPSARAQRHPRAS
ncbi:cytochrome P450 [Streptomyces sp. NPDC096310]|uniref:cytochrome P450 n=1 Tax=Streptomyces sp. NPDC096310 TaxID=3366082 RepID=UPI0037F950EB